MSREWQGSNGRHNFTRRVVASLRRFSFRSRPAAGPAHPDPQREINRMLDELVKERTLNLVSANKRLLEEIKTRTTVETALERSRDELRHLSEHLQRTLEDERKRIAREVHDELGQALSALKIEVSRIDAQIDDPRGLLRDRRRAIERQIDAVIHAVRNTCSELRLPILEDFGLAAAVEWYLANFEKRTGIACTARIDAALPPIADEAALMLFRILQEAMTNVLRHAQATAVHVFLEQRDDTLMLRIKDDGKGMAQDPGERPNSFGILGIRERVRFWGGRTEFEGVANEGTTVTILLPLPAPHATQPDTSQIGAT